MKIVLQRVIHASVTVDGKTTGKIKNGYLILFGVGKDDTESDCKRLADKIINLRIFSDENGKINLSLKDVGGLRFMPIAVKETALTLFRQVLPMRQTDFLNILRNIAVKKVSTSKRVYSELI